MSLPTTTPAEAQAAETQEEENHSPVEAGQESQQEEASEGNPDSNLLEGAPEEGIPEKYVGKSAAEIIKMHREAERVIGRLGSEKSFKEREAEEWRNKYAQLENQFRSQPTPQRQSVAPQEDADPLQVLNSKWEENPKEAIEKAIGTLSQRAQQAEVKRVLEANQRALLAKYEELSKRDDFKELEPEMEGIAKQIASRFQPHQVNTPETLEAIYMMARGRNVDKLVQSEATKQASKQKLVRAEKKAAFSESGASKGESLRRPEDMTREELRKLLPVSDKY